MGAPSAARRRALGLRFRLTLSYVILFTILVLGLGLLFRETLDYTLQTNASAILDEEWAAVKGYLRVERHRPIWFFDRDDQEEAFIVQRLRRVFLLTDALGTVLEVSPDYVELGVESPGQVRDILQSGKTVDRTRYSHSGEPFLVRTGPHLDDGRKEFVLSIGRSLARERQIVDQFMQQYFAVVPLLVFGLGIAGWAMAGRALRPLNDVAQAASSITGTNLSLRIPSRGAGDELDHLIERFNAMVDRLEHSFTQVRQFSIDVSHELRTPITAMRGELEVALLTAKTVEQHREAMMTAMEDCERLGKVVRTLLQLSQAETGQLTLASESVELGAIARDVVEQLLIAAEEKNLQLTTATDPETWVRGDQVQLERLVSNLISNAVKYTPEHGKIDVSVRAKDQEVILEVADTGRGIPLEHQPRIFERFYRVPDGEPNPEKGLGLGLSFVAWIAKVHNARISVASAPGRGSIFTVAFPRIDARSEPVLHPGDRIVA
ncbi:MAG: HAMP domain-containing protein [Bryobacterales bacterium]|nr:HAMP domain-containing protein [Bryobacterales bacterium]